MVVFDIYFAIDRLYYLTGIFSERYQA